MGFLLRWLAAFVLLAATYNPTEWSYIRWAMNKGAEQLPLAVLIGLLLLIAYVLFLTAVLRGIGTLGVILVVAVLGAFVWVLWSYGYLSLENPSANTWIALVLLSIVLAIGMYWGILWRRMSGQLEVDDQSDA